MEILQTLWLNLTTSNEGMTNVLVAFLSILELYITMQLFLTILDIKTTNVRKALFVGTISVISIITNLFFMDNPYMKFLHFISIFLMVMICFKTTLFRTIIAEIIPLIVIALLEPFFVIIFTSLFNIRFDDIATVPIYRVSLLLLMYLSIFIIQNLAKHLKFNTTFLDNIDKRNKGVLILNSIFGMIALIAQLYLFKFYSENMPYTLTAISIIGLVAYFFISIYSLAKTVQLCKAQEDLVESQLYNKSLKILHDNNRAFKHDFSNIVQAIGRLCWVR